MARIAGDAREAKLIGRRVRTAGAPSTSSLRRCSNCRLVSMRRAVTSAFGTTAPAIRDDRFFGCQRHREAAEGLPSRTKS